MKRIRIHGMVHGSVGTVTTNDVYSSDQLPDRFKPLQYIMEVDDFASMAITIHDVHYFITLEDTAGPPGDEAWSEHTERMNGTELHAVQDRKYYHEMQNRYQEVHDHHHALIHHHQAMHDHQHLVQDRYHTVQQAQRLQDRSHALREYYRAVLDHRSLVQDHQKLLQEQYHLLLDLYSEENEHQQR
jgi:hypothetical protein